MLGVGVGIFLGRGAVIRALLVLCFELLGKRLHQVGTALRGNVPVPIVDKIKLPKITKHAAIEKSLAASMRGCLLQP